MILKEVLKSYKSKLGTVIVTFKEDLDDPSCFITGVKNKTGEYTNLDKYQDREVDELNTAFIGKNLHVIVEGSIV